MIARRRAWGAIAGCACSALAWLAWITTAGDARASIASVTPAPARATPAVTPEVTALDLDRLRARALAFPVPGVDVGAVRDTFAEMRGSHRHEAVDIIAPAGTPVVAVDDGVIAKLFTSVPGGLTVYQFDPTGAYCYYYAHLERYAQDLSEGLVLRRGAPIGTVGSSGNAGATAHLHFAVFKLGPAKHWWQGTPIDPHPLLVRPATAVPPVSPAAPTTPSAPTPVGSRARPSAAPVTPR